MLRFRLGQNLIAKQTTSLRPRNVRFFTEESRKLQINDQKTSNDDSKKETKRIV